MIKSEIVQIKKIEDFDNNYIEKELNKSGIIPVRWAVVDIADKYLSVAVSYICE